MAKAIANPFGSHVAATVVSKDPFVKASELVGKTFTVVGVSRQTSFRYQREEWLLSIKLNGENRRLTLSTGSKQRDADLEAAMIGLRSGATGFNVRMDRTERGAYVLLAAE